MINLDKIFRQNILQLKPYSSARDEFQGEADIFLDANENPFNSPYNRYPDPLQRQLKNKIATIKNVPPGTIFLGNGSDEPIDLIIRASCEPGIDNVVAIDPTYGMYKVAADINHVTYKAVSLTENFELESQKVLAACNEHTKIVFLCSPNNPTGNYLNENEINIILQNFSGLVVLDEAYIDFSSHEGYLKKLADFPNLIILQTFSKAWGLASIRLGMAFANPAIIDIMNKIKYPYNINLLTQQFADKALDNEEQKKQWVQTILINREWLIEKLKKLRIVEKVYPTDANFVLVKVTDASRTYNYLIEQKIIVRNRSNVTLCNNCLRITIGTHTENEKLIEALEEYASR